MSKVEQALKAALAAIDLYDYTGTQAESELYAKAEAQCKSALAELEKCEPVAWQFFKDGIWWYGNQDEYHKQKTVEAGLPIRNLYTSPQPKEWVGLTTGMIDEIYQENLDDYEFAVALEAKLKELNT